MATLFSDNFTRANSTNLGADWTEVEDDWEILSNQLNLIDSVVQDSNVRTTTTAHAAVADCKVSAIQVTKDTGGVIARYSTTADTYYLAAQDALNTITLYKKVAGTYTAIQTYTPTSANNATIRLECEGTVQRVFYNGAAQTPVGGDTAITAASQTGLIGIVAAAKFDDFLVEDFASAGGHPTMKRWARVPGMRFNGPTFGAGGAS